MEQRQCNAINGVFTQRVASVDMLSSRLDQMLSGAAAWPPEMHLGVEVSERV